MEADIAGQSASVELTPAQRRRAVTAATLGNGLEFYDFVTFASAPIRLR